ncbi:MAG: DUF2062 domain-containing protein [Gammaproteobacteria bacterium]|nr:DUF2062 domain-containing protein [Gammaproteobacteria bacterium]MBU6510165.1 DUF2062 domain-containing protein [Gammaproteobacteria bacterium]MDE1984068.1 DUF2062 domain-containing protein [Gammaproteobacteria bacterium]MDE2108414.1 DUF2062 domain-containing protein [Gammaproteobacteria bacterium]
MNLRQHRLVRLTLALLSEGMTPHKIALTLALGVLLGAIPVLGTTTVLCALAAVVFRLNLPLIEAVQFLAYPLQLLLLIPFMQAGQWIFRQPPLPFTRVELLALLHSGWRHAIEQLWLYSLHGMVAWVLLGGAGAVLIYLIVRPILACTVARRGAGHKSTVKES